MKRLAISIIVFLSVAFNVYAADLSTVPMRYYQREYQILERAKEIGLVKDVDLSFKPLTREQFAKAIVEIYNNRNTNPKLARYYFNILYPSFRESVDELLKGQSNNYIKPVNDIYTEFDGLSGVNRFRKPYSDGTTLKGGLNADLYFSSKAQFSNFTFYIEPKCDVSNNRFYLNRYYATTSLLGLNILIGRDNVWWGNAENGDLLFTNNIRPWLMFKVENNGYKKLPGLFSHLGGFRFSNFFSQLEGQRPRAYAHVWGMKLSWRPIENLEIAGTRAIEFGGRGRSNYNSLSDFWDMFKAKDENVRSPNPKAHKHDNNQLASIDFTYYLNFLNRLKFQPLKGGKIYFVYAGDDAIHSVGPGGLPLPTAAAHVFGTSLTTGITDIRFEYTETTDSGDIWYTHHEYPEGFTYHGFLIGNAIGGDSKSYYYEVSRDFHAVNVKLSYNNVKTGVYFKPREEKQNILKASLEKDVKSLKLPLALNPNVCRVYAGISYDSITNYSFEEKDKNTLNLSFGINLEF